MFQHFLFVDVVRLGLRSQVCISHVVHVLLLIVGLTSSGAMAQFTPLIADASGGGRNGAGHYKPVVTTTTSRDEKGRIITSVGRQWLVRQTAPPAESRYLGSPYLDFPVWQPGTLVFQNQQEVPVEIAFNTATSQFNYRLPGETEFKMAQPDAFTLKGRPFVHMSKPLGGNYYELLHEGKVRLLKYYVTKLYDHVIQGGAYNGPKEFDGYYRLLTDYYLQEGNERPRFVMLTKQSLLKKFVDQRNQLEPLMPNDRLTEAEAIEIVKRYNQLSVTNYQLSIVNEQLSMDNDY